MAIPAITAFSHPAANNVYLPNVDETLRLLVSYARDPKQFALNEYVTVSPISVPKGYYPKVFAADNVRMRTSTGVDGLWADGMRRPMSTGEYNTSRFAFVDYTAVRYSDNTTLGHETIQYAGWDIKTFERNSLASKLMTRRTQLANTQIFDTANYPTNHTSTPTLLAGGFWGAGTINDPIIKNTLRKIRERISLDTNGKVGVNSLRLVMNPTTAGGIAQSQEIHAYLAQQVGSLDVIEGTNPSSGDNWSLPKKLYGFEVVVDASNINLTKESTLSQESTAFIVPDNKVAVLARPGGIVSDGSIPFSTCHILEMKNFAFNVQEHDDSLHMLLDILMADYFVPIIPAPESGYVLTAVLAA
jgi:hypothetical protein